MFGNRPDFPDPNAFVTGIVAMALRIAVLFMVFGAGYWIFIHFGQKWFYVFIFATLALRLHFELAWIERNYPPGEKISEKGRGEGGPSHPFRKR